MRTLAICPTGLVKPVDDPVTKSNTQLIDLSTTIMYFTQTRSVPEIFEMINAAQTDLDKIRIIKGFSNHPSFLCIVDLWLNSEFDDFSELEYITHNIDEGYAFQTISNNINRLKMLTKKSIEPKKVKDKILSNILHSVNKSEIVLIVALIQGKLNELYPNVKTELIEATLPTIKVK